VRARIYTTTLIAILLLTLAPLAVAQQVTVIASKSVYNPGDELVVMGNAPANSYVTLQVYNPQNDLIAFDQVQADGTGAYTKNIFTWPQAGT
jgi:hypothetical protein